MAMYTDEQIKWQLNRYGGKAHPSDVLDKWREIDEVLKMEHLIRLPTAALRESFELDRLHLHTNYARVVVQSTVTLTLANGVKVYDENKIADETGMADRLFPSSLIRRMLRYMSTYGGAWRLRRPSDVNKPLRIYKPEIAREIYLETDPEVVKAVLAIEKVERRGGDSDQADHYHVARWYEWDDSVSSEPSDWRRVIRKVYISTDQSSTWQHDPRQDYVYSYMPMELVRNRDADNIYEASDIHDALELFKGMDDLTTKWLKALEDEAFRLLILANVTAEQARGIHTVDGSNVLTLSNGESKDVPEPKPYWMMPADHTQYLRAFDELLKRISTTTRTSMLELGEAPEGDIPAQTLRVKYGPQLERVKESADYASRALTEDISQLGYPEGLVRLKPELPVSEDKIHQNRKGLLDVGAYSRRQMLIDEGMSPAEAERILDQALEEERRIKTMEAETQLIVEEAVARIQAENRSRNDTGA